MAKTLNVLYEIFYQAEGREGLELNKKYFYGKDKVTSIFMSMSSQVFYRFRSVLLIFCIINTINGRNIRIKDWGKRFL